MAAAVECVQVLYYPVQFTCFTSAKVHKLTPAELYAGTQFTYFTSTNVHKLTPQQPACGGGVPSSHLAYALLRSLLALLVPKYTC